MIVRSQIWHPFLRQLSLLCVLLVCLLSLQLALPTVVNASPVEEWVEKTVKTGEALGSKAIQKGEAVAETAMGVGKNLRDKASPAIKAATETTAQVKRFVNRELQASQSGQGITAKAKDGIERAARQAGRVAKRTTLQAQQVFNSAALQASKALSRSTFAAKETVNNTQAQIRQFTKDQADQKAYQWKG